MCIRDSVELGDGEKIQSIAIGDLESFKIDKLERSNLFIICLLYTSDAADERSSVDLGGRRIIKKKTHR